MLQAFFSKIATCILGWDCLSKLSQPLLSQPTTHNALLGVYGAFPKSDDPFRFIPCTKESVPPVLDNPHHEQSWVALFDPNPEHWSWGAASSNMANSNDAYDGRGIFLCGYLDLPMDYTNKSDARITRISITKYQISGLARHDGQSRLSTGQKSERTILLNPGGPGISGTGTAWARAEDISTRFTDGQFDVLGMDPRGSNKSQPSLSCYPYDALRDRWAIRSGYISTGQFREVSPSPIEQLKFADAVNEAVFTACKRQFGDFPRFVTAPFVVRDIDRIREALGEEELTSYMISYGTILSQIYVNMFPDRAGRLVLDGIGHYRTMSYVDGIPRTILDNVTDTWRDGFLGECINAGPEYCALARQTHGSGKRLSTRDELENRMESLIWSLRERPVPAHHPEYGPSVITYSQLVASIFFSLLKPDTWPSVARALSALELGNATPAVSLIEHSVWKYHPSSPLLDRPSSEIVRPPSSEEVRPLVLCGDAHYDTTPVDHDLAWWDKKWQDLADKSWLAGNELFNDVLACRHVRKLWVPADVYTGPLNNTLKNPVLLISGTYDPGSQLRNGRLLSHEMGTRNARLVVHHGYGHGSQVHQSNCTNSIIRSYLLEGKIPGSETDCKMETRPYVSRVGAWDSCLGGSCQ